MALQLGIVASSAKLEIPATVLIVNGGNSNQFTYSYSWYNVYGDYYQANLFNGGSGGSYGTRTVTLTGTKSVVVGSLGGGTSSFDGFSFNSPGNTTSVGIGQTSGYYAAYYINTWDYSGYVWYPYGGNGAGGTTNTINGGTSLTLTDFNNAVISGGGGGYSSTNPSDYNPVFGASSSGAGSGRRGDGIGGSSGIVILKYADSFPLPSAGSYSHTTSGGYRYITCSSSTTLSWT